MGAPLPSRPPRRWRVLLQYLAGLAVLAIVVVLLLGKRGQLSGALHRLDGVRPGWAAAAVLAELGIILSFTLLQRRALVATGVRQRLGVLYLLSMANFGIANSLPGEPVVSGAYRYRQYRSWGASNSGAAWVLFIVLMSQSIGMCALLFVGVVVALSTGTGSVGVGAAVGALAVIAAAGAVLVRRDLLLRVASAIVRLTRRLSRRRGRAPGEPGRVEAALGRMREIQLGRRETVEVAALGAAMWACDFLCLLASMRAVHVAIPWHGVLLAYGAAQIVGSLPIVPGGLGIIEGSLSVVLVAYGMGHVGAVAAVLMWRLATYWLMIASGWCAVGALELIGRHRAPLASALAQAAAPDPEPEAAL